MAKPEAFIRMVTTESHISKANMVGTQNWHKSDFNFWPEISVTAENLS